MTDHADLVARLRIAESNYRVNGVDICEHAARYIEAQVAEIARRDQEIAQKDVVVDEAVPRTAGKVEKVYFIDTNAMDLHALRRMVDSLGRAAIGIGTDAT